MRLFVGEPLGRSGTTGRMSPMSPIGPFEISEHYEHAKILADHGASLSRVDRSSLSPAAKRFLDVREAARKVS